jgi:hypothetical protein
MIERAPREQARIRQARKRHREREARLDLQTEAAAERIPPEWRAEFRQRIKRSRARKARAAVEVERTVPLISESGRAEFVARNRTHAKVSITKLRKRFVREKEKAAQFYQRWWEAHYMDNEIVGADDRDECYGGRYPGSPPISAVQALAARHVPGSTIPLDTAAMTNQRAARLAAAPYETLPVELRLMALGLPV